MNTNLPGHRHTAIANRKGEKTQAQKSNPMPLLLKLRHTTNQSVRQLKQQLMVIKRLRSPTQFVEIIAAALIQITSRKMSAIHNCTCLTQYSHTGENQKCLHAGPPSNLYPVLDECWRDPWQLQLYTGYEITCVSQWT